MTDHEKQVVKIFSAKACAAPLYEAAAAFERETGIKIEISVCSRHCAKAEAEEAVGTAGSDDFLLEIAEDAIHDLAIAGAEYLLDEAVAEHKVDAAFGWSAFEHLDPDRVEVIPLPPEQQIQRGTCVGLLPFGKSPEAAETFMDFLASEKARPFYRQYGWTWPAPC